MFSIAVALRYPADFFMPSLEETKEAVKITEDVIGFVLSILQLCRDGHIDTITP